MGPTPFVDRRRSDRERGPIPVHFTIASEDYGVEHEALAIDRSSHGLRIRTAVPLSPGEAVVVMSLGGSRGSISARVVWVLGAEYTFAAAAGLEFLNPATH